jgi:hypothetical protein
LSQGRGTAVPTNENILALIPGDLISDAEQTPPDCATAPDEPHEVTIDVAGRFTATITFRVDGSGTA